jgi:hypothetical protein
VKCQSLSQPILAGTGPRRHRAIKPNEAPGFLQSATSPCPAQPDCS